jgi:putative endonuclease
MRARKRRSSPSQSPHKLGSEAERRVRLHYRLRGWIVVAENARAGGNEIDLIVRRGRRLLFVEVKARRGPAFGDPLEAVGTRKAARIRRAAEAWLAKRPELLELELGFEAVAVRADGRIARTPLDV